MVDSCSTNCRDMGDVSRGEGGDGTKGGGEDVCEGANEVPRAQTVRAQRGRRGHKRDGEGSDGAVGAQTRRRGQEWVNESANGVARV
jgi:hypothetical protein